jgi:hypothetical protein
MKKVIIGSLLILLISCNNQSTVETKKAKDSTIVKTDTVKKNWEFEEKIDEMDGTKKFYATTFSTNTIDFDFPYQGGSSFSLVLRNKGKGNEVMLIVSKGQFLTSVSDDKEIRIKFDDEKPVTYTVSGTSDYSTTVVFIAPAKKLIDKIKTSKKIKIEAEFYNAGYKIIEFDVANLNWN